jgi:hypothetical protein
MKQRFYPQKGFLPGNGLVVDPTMELRPGLSYQIIKNVGISSISNLSLVTPIG